MLADEGEDAILPGPDPGAADIEAGAVGESEAEDAAADALPGLEDDDAAPGIGQGARGRKPGEAGADDAEFGVQSGHLRAPLQGDWLRA